jgi:hypothetical protein
LERLFIEFGHLANLVGLNKIVDFRKLRELLEEMEKK